jgi:hypothetical protein
MDLHIKVRANLLEKTIEIDGIKREVYGLTDFYTRPNKMGIGTKCLKIFNNLAKNNGKFCIIGFCDDNDVFMFYIKAGYYAIGKYQGKNMFASIPIKNVKVIETW